MISHGSGWRKDVGKPVLGVYIEHNGGTYSHLYFTRE